MDAASLNVVCFVVCFLFAILTGVHSGTEKKAIKDCVGKFVCTTLMKYPDGYIADEGPNCFCPIKRQPACNGEWEENSPATLTWQHYERGHWTVQYKLCTPIFEGRPPCAPGERAAVVTTEIKSWHPNLEQPRCRCPNDLFFIDGWKREGVLWQYFYSCEKPECSAENGHEEKGTKKLACAKIYVDRYKSADKVLEVQIACTCPAAHMCPAHLKKKDDLDLKNDARGSYVTNYCEPNVKSADSAKG